MDQKQFDAVLSDAEKRLRRLKVLYEQWFVGIERVEPATPRKELEDMLTRLRKEQLSNTAQRFRLQQLVQRHVAFSTHWRRIGRQIEEGTYERDLRKAKRRQHKGSDKDANSTEIEVSMDVDIDVDVDLSDVLAEADRAAEAALSEPSDAPQPIAAAGQPRNGGVAARSFEVEAEPVPQPVAAGAFGTAGENPGAPALGKQKALAPGMPAPPKLATGAFAVPAAAGQHATGAFAVPAAAGRKTGEHAAPPAHAAVGPGQQPTGEHAAPGAQRATGAHAAPGAAKPTTGAHAAPGAAQRATGAHAAPGAAAPTGEHAAPASATGATVQRATGAHTVPSAVQRPTGAFAAPSMPRKTGEHAVPGANPSGEQPAPAQPRAARPLVPPPAAAAKPAGTPVPPVAAGKPAPADAASSLRAARGALRGTPPEGTPAANGGEARRPSTEPRAISPFALPSAGSVRPQPLTQPKAPPPPPVVPKPTPVQARNPDVQARPAQPSAASKPANNNAPGGSSVDVERIYSQYVAARERNQERTDNVKRDALEKTIRGMLPNLEKKHAGKKIDFEVVVKDGKVALKPIAK